jgi:hypothetical protein
VTEHYVPRRYVVHTLARPGLRTIIYAVLLGFLMSACCRGILALAIQLHKKGASHAAVVAFLLASPWANMPLTFMLLSFFGPKALFIIGSALIIAVVTGLVFQVLDRRGLIETNCHEVVEDSDFSIWEDVKHRIHKYHFSRTNLRADIRGIFQGAVALSRMVLWWILIGMGIASFAGAYIPTHIFVDYMGPNLTGLLVTLGLATVIEVCSEGSSPMAFELFRQTGAFGNTFVFLMAGVVTDYTEIGLIWQNLGRRTAFWLLVTTLPQVLLLGFLANHVW